MQLGLVIIAAFSAVLPMSNSNPAELRSIIPNNLFECDPSRANVVVLQRILQKQGKPHSYIEESLQFPRIGLLPRQISCISIEDLSRGGKGGYPEIVAGGVNYNSVTISFRSQAGEGLQFSIAIFTDIPRLPSFLGNQQSQNLSIF